MQSTRLLTKQTNNKFFFLISIITKQTQCQHCSILFVDRSDGKEARNNYFPIIILIVSYKWTTTQCVKKSYRCKKRNKDRQTERKRETHTVQCMWHSCQGEFLPLIFGIMPLFAVVVVVAVVVVIVIVVVLFMSFNTNIKTTIMFFPRRAITQRFHSSILFICSLSCRYNFFSNYIFVSIILLRWRYLFMNMR